MAELVTERRRATGLANPIVVSGGSGFLGSMICRRFRDEGHAVVSVDRVGRGHETLAARTLDLSSGEVASFVSEIRPWAWIHAAGPASVASSVERPRADWLASADMTGNVLEALRSKCPECIFVFLSSAAVYGEITGELAREEDATNPLSPYGFHKLACEALVREYASVYSVPGCSLRVPSAYGVGLRRQVIWDVVRRSRCSQVIELGGDGRETRMFVDARDVALAVKVALERSALQGEALNVGSERETTIWELARRVAALIPGGREVRFNGVRRGGDPVRLALNSDRIRGLGYSPGVPLEDGLREFVPWALAEREQTA